MSNIETLITAIIGLISIVYAMCERLANKVLCRWMKDNGIVPNDDEIRKYTEQMIKEFFRLKG